ncbi:MAG: glycosyltransferase family 2 protein [Marinoscillum sp.]
MTVFPRISIVTPSYNQGQFIEETITSVLDQNYPNLEYIIIDGGSSDQTVDIIRKYERYLKYWVSEPDHGQSDAINKGLKQCTGDIFNWLNSDDLLAPDSLKVVSEYFRKGDLNVLAGKEIHFGNGAEKLKYGTKIYSSIEQNVFHSVFYQPSTFWKAELVKEFGVSSDLHYLMDTYLWVQFLLKYGSNGALKIDDTLAKFRLHENSKSVDQASLFARDRWSIRVALIDQLTNLPKEFISFGKMRSNEIELKGLKLSSDLQSNGLKKMYMRQLFGELQADGLSNEARKVGYWLINNDFRWDNVKNLVKAYLK